MELHLDEQEMKAEVLRYVAIGAAIEDAKATMESQGFKCEFDRDWQGERSMDADSAKYGEAYLICSKMKPQRTWKESLYLSDEIKVFFSFRDGKVVGVRVKHIPCCL
jgi:hypothetical protein